MRIKAKRIKIIIAILSTSNPVKLPKIKFLLSKKSACQIAK
jgi:hypothetical protein